MEMRDWSLVEAVIPKPGGQVKNTALLIQTSSGKKIETLISKAACEVCLKPGL